ncbi:basic salivary proline-rich protein 3-like [Meles meles]|uniref:basic salivary proline-rich protein 3-like n=1 Tax=Meles meles TaxID=9662 RepID=UPI001E69BA8F|nr:basic salivary proline-rich protein 3-like [Meles meles]
MVQMIQQPLFHGRSAPAFPRARSPQGKGARTALLQGNTGHLPATPWATAPTQASRGPPSKTELEDGAPVATAMAGGKQSPEPSRQVPGPRAAPAPARGSPPRRPRGGLLPPSRGSGEGARPRRRRWRRLRLGWLPPRGREAAVSLAPRHPPPPAANPHPGWGEGDANYPGSGSARPPPPRPSPACTRPRIPGLACAARPLGPPPSPGSAGWVTPPQGGGPRGGGLGTVTQPGWEGPRGGEGAGPRAAQPEAGDRHRPPARGARLQAPPPGRLGPPPRRAARSARSHWFAGPPLTAPPPHRPYPRTAAGRRREAPWDV